MLFKAFFHHKILIMVSFGDLEQKQISREKYAQKKKYFGKSVILIKKIPETIQKK